MKKCPESELKQKKPPMPVRAEGPNKDSTMVIEHKKRSKVKKKREIFADIGNQDLRRGPKWKSLVKDLRPEQEDLAPVVGLFRNIRKAK